MSQQTWNDGDTGDVVKDVIDDNFTELYTFPNVHVENFGAVGDGVTDDTASFVAAATYAKANDLVNVMLSKKSYVLSSRWDISGLNIIGNNATLLCSGTESLYVSGARPDSFVNITADAYEGETYLNVTSDFADSVEVGDIIKIIHDEISWEDVRYGEMHKVREVDTDNDKIYFSDPLFHTYTTSNTARAGITTMTTGSVRDFKIKFPEDTTSIEKGITINYGENYVISRVVIENAYQVAVFADNCYLLKADFDVNNSIKSGLGYGMSLGTASMYSDITGRWFRCRHCFTSGSGETTIQSYYGGVSWGTLVHDAIGVAGPNGGTIFDTHGSTGSISFDNCTAYGIVKPEFEDVIDWAIGTSYVLDDVVRRDGQYYTAQGNTTGDDPLLDYSKTNWVYTSRCTNSGFQARAPEVRMVNCSVYNCGVGFASNPLQGGRGYYLDGAYMKNCSAGIVSGFGSSFETITIKNIVHDNDFLNIDGYTISLPCDADYISIDNIDSKNVRTVVLQSATTAPAEIVISNIKAIRDNEQTANPDSAYAINIGTATGITDKITVSNVYVKNMSVLYLFDNVATTYDSIILNNVECYGTSYYPFRIRRPATKLIINSLVNDDVAAPLIFSEYAIGEVIVNGSYSCENIFELDAVTGSIDTYMAHGGIITDANDYDFESDEMGLNDFPIELEGRRIWKGLRVPENNVTAEIGTQYINKITGYLYMKQSGSGNTGWVQIT